MKLNVNIDHVATLRNARGGSEPDPIHAARAVERAGAHGITVHLREDRRHIRDADVWGLRRTVKTKFNLEMAAIPEMVGLAERVKPDWATLVPEKRKELTTEGGLDVARHLLVVSRAVARLQRAGIAVSVFIDPELRQVRAAQEAGATMIELHTGSYAEAVQADHRRARLYRIHLALEEGRRLGLVVNAGHGLNYGNMTSIVRMKGVEEFSVGHSIIARALEVGLERAVREMLTLINSI